MDIEINSNSISWVDGDFKLVSGLEKIKQQIIVALYTLLGDWLLDDRRGADYPRGFRDEAFMVHGVKKQILGVEGVTNIQKIDISREGLTIKIKAAVSTIYGGIDLNEVIAQ